MSKLLSVEVKEFEMKKRTKIFIVTGIIIALCVITGAVVYNHLGNNLEALTKIDIPSMSLSEAKDGSYKGSYSAFPVSAEVEVTVESHKIIAIDLIKHVTGQGQAAESIPATVVTSQSINVDTVSGATYSSVVILKAIENALVLAGAKPV
jgi:uncharacterized protein with FMN-binding domain